MEYIYEKDLFGMKYKIITCPMHDRVIAKLSECLDMNVQELRMVLIEKLDMSFLENIPARYNSWKDAAGYSDDKLSEKLCLKLFTEHIPVLSDSDALRIKESCEELKISGLSEDEAVKAGKEMLREAFLKWA